MPERGCIKVVYQVGNKGAAAMNGTMVKRYKDTIFLPLPRELWREIEGGCACMYCSDDNRNVGKPAYWDTLAISKLPPRDHKPDTAWTVHYPELNGARSKRKGAL
jgi:hypothetical protein